ncbi:hypothetical protein LSAT2_029278 [Lamellibrachia satsuma]|nr:hypothetical protein LSAT2_029278 [Lamellibrachia satsuma]
MLVANNYVVAQAVQHLKLDGMEFNCTTNARVFQTSLQDATTQKETVLQTPSVRRESSRQRRRLQPQYATMEEQTRATVRRSIVTVAATLSEAVGRSTDDTFRSSCLSLLQVRDTRQLKEAITRKLWQLSSEKQSLDGAVAGLDRAVDDGMKATSSMSSSQNVDSFDDLALNLADADVHIAERQLEGGNLKKRRTDSCPVQETQREPIAEDWFSDIVDG